MGETQVLIVDDSRLSLQLMSALLKDQREGLRIETENRPEAALKRLESDEFDLLVLDMNMPGCSGEEVACQVRENGKTLPICFVTANVQSTLKQRLEEHYGPVFNKPVNEKLAISVLAYMDQARSC